ncbi:MAG: DNA repair protein RecO C-terminal domain-containing protein, partial [Pseudomonadota bacterium]|nr:DNA repair protein RecO C-terminal domain-containing protein [Pseudomonadota bacterium]
VRLLGRGDPHEDLFAFYHAALTELGEGVDPASVLRRFELRLLQEIGYAVALDREADGGRAVVAEGRYVYEPELGVRSAGVKDGGLTVSGETLLRLTAGEPLAGAQAKEARELMRRLLAPYLGGRPLKSRELFRHWRE